METNNDPFLELSPEEQEEYREMWKKFDEEVSYEDLENYCVRSKILAILGGLGLYKDGKVYGGSYGDFVVWK